MPQNSNNLEENTENSSGTLGMGEDMARVMLALIKMLSSFYQGWSDALTPGKLVNLVKKNNEGNVKGLVNAIEAKQNSRP